jgi:hypothetical protein
VADINKLPIISYYPIFAVLGVWYSEFVYLACLCLAQVLYLFLEKRTDSRKMLFVWLSHYLKKTQWDNGGG